MLSNNKYQDINHTNQSQGTQGNPRHKGPQANERGVNRFGADVDQGLLLRFSKDQELWWVEGGHLVILVAPNGVFFLCRTSSLRWKKGKGIYSPTQNVAVAVVEGRIIRPKYGRIIRAGMKSLGQKSAPVTG
jgi:hypothetical protein